MPYTFTSGSLDLTTFVLRLGPDDGLSDDILMCHLLRARYMMQPTLQMPCQSAGGLSTQRFSFPFPAAKTRGSRDAAPFYGRPRRLLPSLSSSRCRAAVTLPYAALRVVLAVTNATSSGQIIIRLLKRSSY